MRVSVTRASRYCQKVCMNSGCLRSSSITRGLGWVLSQAWPITEAEMPSLAALLRKLAAHWRNADGSSAADCRASAGKATAPAIARTSRAVTYLVTYRKGLTIKFPQLRRARTCAPTDPRLLIRSRSRGDHYLAVFDIVAPAGERAPGSEGSPTSRTSEPINMIANSASVRHHAEAWSRPSSGWRCITASFHISASSTTRITIGDPEWPDS